VPPTPPQVVMLHPTADVTCLLGRNWGCAGAFATGRTTRVLDSSSAGSEVVSARGFTPAEAKTVTTGVNPEIATDNKYVGLFEPYGSLRAIVGITDDQAQVQAPLHTDVPVQPK
jgi:hypothetical protein